MIKQQFYKEGCDLIIGRTPEVSLKITNSGKIIRKFKDLFNENINFFLEGNYLKFLSLFKKIKGIDENYIKEIYQDLQFKFEALKEVDKNHLNIIVIYSIVLNSIISSIRDVNFNNAISEIKQRVKRKN